MRHRHRHLPRGVAARRPPYFSSSPPLPQEMAPHTAGPRQKAKNCDTFSPFGEGGGERRGGGERLCCSTTRRHLAQVSPSPRPAEGEGGRKKVQSKRVRAHSPRHGGIRRSDGSVSLGMCASHPAFGGMASLLPPRWSAAARGGHLSARPPSDGEEGGGGGGVSETCGLLLLLQASLH